MREAAGAAGRRASSCRSRDDGPGIAPQHLPRLTERFYRVNVAASREKGGTGLGLAIVKHILNRHRGELNVSSKVGEGSTFSVVLPALSGSAAPAARQPPDLFIRAGAASTKFTRCTVEVWRTRHASVPCRLVWRSTLVAGRSAGVVSPCPRRDACLERSLVSSRGFLRVKAHRSARDFQKYASVPSPASITSLALIVGRSGSRRSRATCALERLFQVSSGTGRNLRALRRVSPRLHIGRTRAWPGMTSE